MNNQQLQSFLTSVECGSFSKAEEKLSLSKQAIRKQISALEEELGVTLLQRTNRGIILTNPGAEFYKDAGAILEAMRSAIEKCNTYREREKVIRIATPGHPRLRLDKAFIEFARRYPDVRQQMIVQPSNKAIGDILAGNVDIAEYTYQPELDDAPLGYVPIGLLPFKCLVAPTHRLASKKSLTVEDLSGEHIGHNVRDTALVTQIKMVCTDITLEGFSEYGTQFINNLCFNGGVFISKAYFVESMAPLIAIPLETDYTPVGVVIYRKKPPKVVLDFLEVVKALFPSV